MADALVMAGGRITGAFARATGTDVKGLVQVEGVPLVRRVVETLREVPGIERVCVAGPESTRAVLPAGVAWTESSRSIIVNLQRGVEALGPSDRLLLCGTDLPVLTPPALVDLLERAPQEAEIVMPVVRKERFVAAFPNNMGIYVRLVEGSFTSGGQYLIRPRPFLEALPLLERLFHSRKSQIAMAAVLGRQLVWKLIAHRLTVEELEARLSELTGCRCRALMDCAPELSYDIDCLPDLWYIEKWLARRSP